MTLTNNIKAQALDAFDSLVEMEQDLNNLFSNLNYKEEITDEEEELMIQVGKAINLVEVARYLLETSSISEAQATRRFA